LESEIKAILLRPAGRTSKDRPDEQIDRLVYQLYGLTEDEIKIIEESGQR